MERADYEASIFARLDQAIRVPFRDVSLEDWRPAHNDCHNNVDIWVMANPSCTAVRGWMIESISSLTAHSVVREADGQYFDVTPFRNESLRLGFIEHEGDDVGFDRMKAASVQIFGLTVDREELARYFAAILDVEVDVQVMSDDMEAQQ